MDSVRSNIAPPFIPLPDKGQARQDAGRVESRPRESAREELRGIDNYGESTTHSHYQYQGQAAVAFEDPFYCFPYENLVSGSKTLGDVHGYREPVYGDPAVLAPAKSREKTPRMVYDWEGKEELCYKLYITENKSLEEIMEFFKVTQDFAPRYVVEFCPCYGMRSCIL